jgi:dCTP deaminase
MLLSAAEIEAEVEQGRISIKPFDPRLIRRASYTLRLGNRWRRWRKSSDLIRIWSPNAASTALEPLEKHNKLVLHSGDFVLGCTAEKISVPDDLSAFICTLSQVGRFGITTTSGSLLVRPGFGQNDPMELTLELTSSNPSPIEMVAGMPICHLVFIRLNGAAREGRESLYVGAPAAPSLYEDMSAVIDLPG